MSSNRTWTTDQIQYLHNHYGLRSDKAIARYCGRTVVAVRQYAVSHGICRTQNFLTGSDVARIFGVGYHTAKNWINRAYLSASKSKVVRPESQKAPWVITEENVRAFIRNHPTRFDPTKITDPYYRNIAAKHTPSDLPLAKRRRNYWTATEDEYLLSNYRRMTDTALGEKLNRTKDAVHARKMLLRAKGRVAPYKSSWRTRLANGTAKAPRLISWSEADNGYLRENWGRTRRPEEALPAQFYRHKHITCGEIARVLGRSEVACWTQARRLGLANYLLS